MNSLKEAFSRENLLKNLNFFGELNLGLILTAVGIVYFKNPNHFAVRQYKKYKLAAGKTAKSNLISCGARLAPFDIKELRDLTAYDELELDTLGEKKTALFILQENPSLHHCLAVNFQVLERTP